MEASGQPQGLVVIFHFICGSISYLLLHITPGNLLPPLPSCNRSTHLTDASYYVQHFTDSDNQKSGPCGCVANIWPTEISPQAKINDIHKSTYIMFLTFILSISSLSCPLLPFFLIPFLHSGYPIICFLPHMREKEQHLSFGSVSVLHDSASHPPVSSTVLQIPSFHSSSWLNNIVFFPFSLHSKPVVFMLCTLTMFTTMPGLHADSFSQFWQTKQLHTLSNKTLLTKPPKVHGFTQLPKGNKYPAVHRMTNLIAYSLLLSLLLLKLADKHLIAVLALTFASSRAQAEIEEEHLLAPSHTQRYQMMSLA